MRLSHAMGATFAVILATGCAHTAHDAAQDRAAQAEADRQHAADDARQARIDSNRAHREADDAARAQHEADLRAQYAAQEAAQADRDAQHEQYAGVAEAQPAQGTVAVAGPDPGVAFAAGSYDLSGDERGRLDQVAADLRNHPGRHVVIRGYSDDTNNASADAQIAQQRADAVAHYLERRGVSGDRISTKVGTWSDDTGRRHWRRHVELVIR
jgi:outer membrane protein OmpA-like peptidoglycan-associated protein